jgi:hypothetical protein
MDFGFGLSDWPKLAQGCLPHDVAEPAISVREPDRVVVNFNDHHDFAEVARTQRNMPVNDVICLQKRGHRSSPFPRQPGRGQTGWRGPRLADAAHGYEAEGKIPPQAVRCSPFTGARRWRE